MRQCIAAPSIGEACFPVSIDLCHLREQWGWWGYHLREQWGWWVYHLREQWGWWVSPNSCWLSSPQIPAWGKIICNHGWKLLSQQRMFSSHTNDEGCLTSFLCQCANRIESLSQWPPNGVTTGRAVPPPPWLGWVSDLAIWRLKKVFPPSSSLVYWTDAPWGCPGSWRGGCWGGWISPHRWPPWWPVAPRGEPLH